MSPAYVLEPTYDALRRRLLAGAWPSGYRLEAARLASELGVSITPVRDSLNRLTGEQLVHSSPGDGFQVPRLNETQFCTLLEWHHALISLAFRWTGSNDRPMLLPQGHNGIADRTALLFSAIGGVAGNGDLDGAIGATASKLSRYRHREDEILIDAYSELGEIEALVRADNRAQLVRRIEHYHRRRSDAAAQLVHLTYSA